MKKCFYPFLLLLGLSMIMSSCSYKVYPVSTLEFNYDMNMQTAEELSAKTNIPIFLSEEDVPKPYEVLAYVKYKPIIIIPIIAPERAQQLKKFYKKAVLKAEQLGGNGVLVNSVADFRVIDIPTLKEKEAIAAPTKSLILSSAVLDKFTDGSIYTIDKRQRTKYVNMLIEEIEGNLRGCKTHEEVDAISDKIDALGNYYQKMNMTAPAQEKQIDGYKAALKGVEKKIDAKASKGGKKASSGVESVSNAVGRFKSKLGIDKNLGTEGKVEKEDEVKTDKAEEKKVKSSTTKADEVKQTAKASNKSIESTEYLTLFEDGTVSKATKKEQGNYEKAFMKEIENNLKVAKTMDDYQIIIRKVAALELYNESNSNPNQFITDSVQFYKGKINKATSKLK